jgi:hypothetical protein
VLRGVELSLIAAVALACSRGRAPSPQAGSFEAAAPRVYVAKVKNLLIGLPPSDEEVQRVIASPQALGPLVDGWMKRPEYQQKMLRFFQLAFQQTQINAGDFLDQIYAQIGLNEATTPLLLGNLQESFARTMLALTAQGHPLTEAMTTRQLMMTTATKELYGFLDTVAIDNDGLITDLYRQQNRTVPITIGAAQGPIPLAETLDPGSPNFMHWYDPDVATAYAGLPACHQDPIVLTPVALSLHYLLLGTIDARKLQDGTLCPRIGGSAQAPQFTADDFRDWTMVTIREPREGEETTRFYDLEALRSARELVLRVPRIGYFSTPAFFANWPTNVSNQMRATVHQALIVATGAAIDGSDETSPATTPGLEEPHARPGECFVCHRQLDPTRSVFSSTWSWHYRRQQDPAWTAETGLFAFAGVVAPVQTLADFAAVLARHPRVAAGWTQKLCHYLGSAPCDERDPEFQRIVTLFRGSQHSFSALVKALVTSPLITHATPTTTGAAGEVVAVARRDHLCAALSARLGITGVCGAESLRSIVSGLPSDAYARGAVTPILPNQPTLFFRAGLENLCAQVAVRVIDAPEGPGWSSARPEEAIRAFVDTVMALPPGDPRAGEAQAALSEHFADAQKEPGITAGQALQSTFVVACLAPSAVAVGL